VQPYKPKEGLLQILATDGRVIGTWEGKSGTGVFAPSGVYMFRIKTKDVSGNEYYALKYLTVIASADTSISGPIIKMSDESVNITAYSKGAGFIDAGVYNIRGELIRSHREYGENLSFMWDKKTVSGSKTSRGVYIIVIRASESKTGFVTLKTEKIAITK